MAKNIFFRSQIFAMFGLISAGCIPAETLASKADSIIDGTRAICRFAPTTTSILSILSVPGAGAADEIVEAICAEVNKKSSGERLRLGRKLSVNVNGIRVDGYTAR